MTEPTPNDAVQVVPPGRVVYGMQLPIQSQSRLYVAKWETRPARTSSPESPRPRTRPGSSTSASATTPPSPSGWPTRWGRPGTTRPRRSAGWPVSRRNVRLLSHVLVLAQRHPLRAAKELSTLDLLSGGRLIVGVGAGHVAEEYDLLAGDFADRGRHTDEAVAALAVAFTDEFPTLPGPAVAGRRDGRRPTTGPAAAATDLDRRVEQGRHPADRRARRRLAAPGHAP